MEFVNASLLGAKLEDFNNAASFRVSHRQQTLTGLFHRLVNSECTADGFC